MAKKEIEILDKSKKFIFSIKYELSSNYLTALLLIHSNNSSIEFTQRSSKKPNDIHGLEISWMMCDEMVDIGLLAEDDESYNVRYVITSLGIEIINKINRK
jgi:hypothetical protein